MRRSGNMATVHVKRTFFAGTWTVSSGATAGFWHYFNPLVQGTSVLDPGFNNFSEFGNVFDRYRVNGIRLTFIPRFQQVAAPTTGATPITTPVLNMTHVVDPQSTLTPAGLYSSTQLNTLLEHGGQTRQFRERALSVYWKPQVALPTNIGGGVWYKKCPFLTTNNTAVPMRGVHVFFHTNNFSTTFTDCLLDVMVTWYVTFKNIK